jgi:glycosyltransferase involved in cell wall biosynthesis
LHWITGGMLKVSSLRALRRPLVWTLHDMWAFTGGCHYDNDCGRFAAVCGQCPVLRSTHQFDLSQIGWRRKYKAYGNLPLHIVTPSRWLGDLAQNSPLLGRFPVSVIPNAIDTNVFRPVDKQLARQLLGLPAERKIILFGALRATTEERKGYRFLVDALMKLSAGASDDKLTAAVLGASRPKEVPDLGMESIFLGTMSDDVSLALAYSAADVLVAPSSQENLSNAVMESLSCGTPVVAFRIGGMPDMIAHENNGYLAKPFDTADLANGLAWVLADPRRHAALGSNAREFVIGNFSSQRIAGRHTELYERVLGERAAALA